MTRAIPIVLCVAILGGCNFNDTVRDAYQWVLNPSVGSSAQEQIALAFDTEDADRRREGILALSERPGGLAEPYLKAYAVLAEDPDPLVRCTAIGALGRAGDATYLDVIVQALTDADLRVANVHGPEAVKPLRKHAATDPEADIRARCVRALGGYRTKPVLDTLVAALDDEEYGVRYTARQTLAAMTGEDAAYDRRAWRRTLAAKDDPFAQPVLAQRRWWQVW